MGLVDYSESESSGSESEAAPKTTTKAAQLNSKKPAFQKVVDRSNPGKIKLNLPQPTAPSAPQSDGPPAKRARTTGTSGGLFAGFNSFLPAPKNANKSATGQSRPGVQPKTSAEPGFSRDGGSAWGESSGGGGGGDDVTTQTSQGMFLPPPKRNAEPAIPEGQKPAEEVKLVGKPLMFKPLSVARNSSKKKAPKPKPTMPTDQSSQPSNSGTNLNAAPTPATAPPKKKSLFSMHVEEPSQPMAASSETGAYEPLFETAQSTDPYSAGAWGGDPQYMSYDQTATTAAAAPAVPAMESLGSIADDMNLSAAARRELFGRGGGGQGAKKVINFNMDQEYQHNEEIRAAGEQQTHNPVKAIQSGKHSLKQLVQNVHTQRDALEESFSKGRINRKEASSKYGW